MEKKTCKECIHFHQHYAIGRQKIFQVYCGHCTQGRARKKKPDCAACEYFVQTQPKEDAFVTKEYLSKELLQHFLRLELFPPIEDLAKDL